MDSYKSHIAVLIVPAVLALLAAVLLIQDFRSDSQVAESDQVSLATTTTVTGDVKRKSQKRLVWFDVSNSQDLFQNDTIRTAENSLAIIRFEDGATIELSENSLIVLNKTKEKVEIDFVSGNVLTKGTDSKTGGLVLRSKGVTLDVGAANVKLSAEKGKSAKINVEKGKVIVRSGEEATTVGENQEASFSKTGLGKVKTVPFKLVSPAKNNLFPTDHTAAVEFQWKKIRPVKKAVLEISKTDNFKKLVAQHDVNFQKSLSLNLDFGKFYWRIKDEDGNASDQETFQVDKMIPIELFQPAKNKTVYFEGDNPRLIFRWKGPAYLEKYLLEVSKDQEFKEIVSSVKVEGENQAVELSEEGNYFWRVKGHGPRLTGPQVSEIQTFALKEGKDPGPLLAAPTILAPEPEFSRKSIAPPDFHLDLKWELVRGATRYEILIVPVSSGRMPAAIDENRAEVITMNDTVAPVKSLDPKSYMWAVRGIDKNGNKGQLSDLRRFHVIQQLELLPPPLLLPHELAQKRND